ncbi:Fic family protein [Lysobacter tyrosinilyticus]
MAHADPNARWAWSDADAASLVHPLASHAIARSGRPDFREGTLAAERVSTQTIGQRLVAAFLSHDFDALVSALLECAELAGVKAPALRREVARLVPDGAGVSVAFASPEHIVPRLIRMQDLARDASLPAVFRAVALQAAVLNLHPLRDGNGRVSRVLYNALLWQESYHPALHVPIYALRRHAPHSFEICLRELELQGRWSALTGFHATLLESLVRSLAPGHSARMTATTA